MNCEQVQELLPEFADRQIRQALVAGVEEHLRQCPSCSNLLAVYRQNIELLATFPLLDPPADLGDRILERTTRRRGVLAYFDRYFGIPAPVYLSAAAALLIALLSPAFLKMETEPSRAANKYLHRAWSYSVRMYGKAEGMGQEIATFKNVLMLILDQRVDQIQDELENYSTRKEKTDQQSSQRGIIASEGSSLTLQGARDHVLRES